MEHSGMATSLNGLLSVNPCAAAALARAALKRLFRIRTLAAGDGRSSADLLASICDRQTSTRCCQTRKMRRRLETEGSASCAPRRSCRVACTKRLLP